MSSLNDLTSVIDRTAFIENLIDQIIINFSSPRKEAHFFFWQVMLNSSVMSLGAKVKVTMAISHECEVKIHQDSIHKLIALRNAFAHHETESHPCMVLGKDLEEVSQHYSLHTFSNSGKINSVKRDDALLEFDDLYVKCKVSLLPLVQKTKELSLQAI